MRQTSLVLATACLAWASLVHLEARADRGLVWTVASEAALERELNTQSARGLRLAAVSDGLPCTVAVLQGTERPTPSATYRVVADRDLPGMLASLVGKGFAPKLAHRRPGGRAHVIFEHLGTDRTMATWQLIEFADMNALQPALASAAADGFQARMMVRYPFKSWPGLSEKGLMLAVKSDAAKVREVLVVAGQSRNVEEAARRVADAAANGFSLDLLVTGSRDGSPSLRRERLHVLMSREVDAATTPRPVKLERASSFGIFGSGLPLGAAPFWDEYYVYAWSPAERRQTWASPIRLSADEAGCASLSFTLRFDAPRDQAFDVVGLVARKVSQTSYELVYLTDQKIGG